LLLQAGIDTLLAFMNHFPLFALMQKAKDPWRIPGTVGLTLDKTCMSTHPRRLGGIYFATSIASPASPPVLIVKVRPFLMTELHL